MKYSKPLFFGAIFLAGCSAQYRIDHAISEFNTVRSSIHLGQSKDDVIAILEPTQEQLSVRNRKQPEQYIDNGNLIEVYYARTGRQADGLTTDDEFTPYVFKNGKLVGIGWTILGGIKSQGQAVQHD